MDAAGYRSEGHYGEAETVWHVMQRSADVEPRGRDGDFRLVEVFLNGGAPWGFTLRGGLEHHEPLVITKVEEGSKAAAVGLQVADELVNINEIPLSGYRQEAICLVKGSHKTLSLVVKRRNEPISRPHSWHSTKFNENQSEPAKPQSPPAQVWHTRYDASSSSADLSWEQTNLRRVSDQFSSMGSMDSLEHVPHPYPAGPLTSAKSNNSMEHLGGGGGGGGAGKRDSAYSSFSTSSGTPDYTLSKSNTASTENVLYKVSQWDTGGKHLSSRNNQIEGARQDDRVTYFQMPGCEGQHSEDQAGSRISTSSRPSYGPVWHVPEKNKKTSSPSPPPPAPPTRSDSFAATKQHERGPHTGHFEAPPEPHGKMAAEHRRSYNLSPKNDFDNLNQNVHGQFSSNKQHSSNSQQGHHSDKSTFYPQPWTSSAAKPYSSAQETPSNGSTHSQIHRRNLSTSSLTTEQNNEGSNRYYCVTTNPPLHPNVQQPFVAEDRRVSTSSERMSLSPQTVTKIRYSLPPPQHATQAKAMEERGNPVETLYTSYPSNRTSEQRRSMPVQPASAPQDMKPQVNSQICPKTTPILHSLSLDASTNLDESSDGKNVQRNDRFATTLRNEIQMRRAKLQKSKSAATLPANEAEVEGDQEVWKSSEYAAPTSNAYKDNLKEMQARVLKATSFRRRDLEPVLVEHPISELPPNFTSVSRKEINLSLPPVSESVRSKSGPGSVQVTRIGGRKRFSTEKKVRSFSEPDQIHHVGMREAQTSATSSSDRESGAAAFVQSSAKNHVEVRPQSYAAGVDTTLAPRGGPEDVQGGSANAQPAPEHQRLGTFAEYEERWSVNKKPAGEQKASGRYRSADNILDHGTEERSKNSTCFHERSRSSPSADVFVPKFPAPATKSENEYSQAEENKPAEQLSAATGLAERLREQPVEHYTAPPTRPGTASNRGGPAVPSHKPTAISLDPEADEEGPEFGPTCQDVVAPGHPSPASVPAHCPKTEPELGEGPVDKGQGAEQQQPVITSSHMEIGLNSMEAQRPPSPQFSPQRLSDKPPASLNEDANANRIEPVVETQNPAVKKVPIRIVHSGAAEKENCPFLRHPDPTPPEAQTVATLSSLSAGGQDSVFCAFTRQKEQDVRPQNPPQKDAYINTVRDHNMNADEQGNNNNKPTDSSTEEKKRAELARDIMGKDKSLAEILDQSRMRTTMDLMEGIFPQGGQLIEGAQQRRKGPVKQPAPRPQDNREKEENMGAVTMVTSATYYSTSAPKAELLIKMKDMPEEEVDSEEELDMDLANKKQELIDSLTKKLQVLREARESLQEDVLDNNALGDEVEAQVQLVCKPNELDKFRMFVGDLDKVVSLLLSLSGRLARVENALNSLEEDATPEERRTLIEKRKLLIRQHEDAKELKENLDRRERVVFDILSNYLQEETLTDYEHFVKMKSALIIEQRKLEDKIKLGEEQLKCLLDSLPIEQRLNL
uniref:Shroom family member 2 n=1 Tax=Neogobius melanostomus TaxID=47308 RepID=A0A8C6TZN5_9GOBI